MVFRSRQSTAKRACCIGLRGVHTAPSVTTAWSGSITIVRGLDNALAKYVDENELPHLVNAKLSRSSALLLHLSCFGYAYSENFCLAVKFRLCILFLVFAKCSSSAESNTDMTFKHCPSIVWCVGLSPQRMVWKGLTVSLMSCSGITGFSSCSSPARHCCVFTSSPCVRCTSSISCVPTVGRIELSGRRWGNLLLPSC